MTKNISNNAGTATLTAGELDNRNIGSIVSFECDGSWAVITLAAVVQSEEGTVLYAAHLPDEEWLLADGDRVYATQPLAERFLYDIRRSLYAMAGDQR